MAPTDSEDEQHKNDESAASADKKEADASAAAVTNGNDSGGHESSGGGGGEEEKKPGSAKDNGNAADGDKGDESEKHAWLGYAYVRALLPGAPIFLCTLCGLHIVLTN